MKKSNLKSLFFKSGFLLAFVPLFLALVLVFFQVQSKITQKLDSEFQLISQQLTHQIEEHLQDNLSALRYLTQTPLVREHILNDWDQDARVRELFLAFCKSHTDFHSVHLIQSQPELRYFASTQANRVTQKVPKSINDAINQTLDAGGEIERVNLRSGIDSVHWDVLLSFRAEDEELHFLEAEIDLAPLIKHANSLLVMNQKQSEANRLLILDKGKRVLNSLEFDKTSLFEPGTDILVYEESVEKAGLKIVVAVNKSLAYEDLKSLILIFLLPFASMILLIVIGSAVTASKLSNPIRELQMMSKELSRGHAVSGCVDSNILELENLASSMQFMGIQIQIKENELKEAARDLEEKVQLRSKKYFELYEEYKALLQMLSHDLSNTIHSLQISLESSQRGLPPEAESLLSKARDFLKKFKEMEAIQEGFLDFQVEDVTMEEIMEDVHILYAPKLRSKNIELKYACKISGIVLKVDREWFTMTVISNILSNALKFSHPGGLIEIEVNFIEAEGIVLIRVCDQGIGIEKTRLKSLLNAGKGRRSSIGTSGEQGTGFGLLLASKVVQEMGGSLGINSIVEEEDPVNHGTCVEVKVKGYANSDS